MTTAVVKSLIASPSPRDLVEVKEALDQIKEDKLFVKYYKEKYAYRIIRNFFLERPEYNYLVICPDDLVVTNEGFQRLKKKVEQTNLPVLAGVCNLSWNEMDTYSFCMNVSGFKFVTLETFQNIKNQQQIGILPKDNNGILKVGHEGFACTFISREVMEKVSFEGLNDDKDAHFDWAFSLECSKLQIPLHVYLEARFLHLRDRLGKGVYESWGMGKPPAIVFEKSSQLVNVDPQDRALQ